MPDRWRLGRNNKQIIYRQTGDEPSKTDRLVLVAFDPEEAAMVVGILNRATVSDDDPLTLAQTVCVDENPHRSCILW